MIPDIPHDLIRQAADMIRSSSYTVVFSGAGISTPSGIPDFRSTRTGLWNRYDPMQSASLSTFHQHPERFYEWFRPLAGLILSAKPNPAHLAVAELQKSGWLRAVITQNIDALHQAAGSSLVIELHGSAATLTCQRCRQRISLAEIKESLTEGSPLPACPRCAAILKPDVVLFEEMLPANAWEQASIHTAHADLMIVVGSSLEVIPAARLPAAAVENGARLLLCNLSPTFLDSEAQLLIPYDVSVSLPLIAAELR